MKHFTESPYEELMGLEPEAARPAPPQAPPPGDRCRGCPYGRIRPCIGVCMRELAGKREAGEQGNGRKERNSWERKQED